MTPKSQNEEGLLGQLRIHVSTGNSLSINEAGCDWGDKDGIEGKAALYRLSLQDGMLLLLLQPPHSPPDKVLVWTFGSKSHIRLEGSEATEDVHAALFYTKGRFYFDSKVACRMNGHQMKIGTFYKLDTASNFSIDLGGGFCFRPVSLTAIARTSGKQHEPSIMEPHVASVGIARSVGTNFVDFLHRNIFCIWLCWSVVVYLLLDLLYDLVSSHSLQGSNGDSQT